jgi:hypothetical protein
MFLFMTEVGGTNNQKLLYSIISIILSKFVGECKDVLCRKVLMWKVW